MGSITMNKNEIPSKLELSELPHLAQVAFTARCARHLQPLFLAAWLSAPQEYIDSLENAISLAEDFSTYRITNFCSPTFKSTAIRYAAAARTVADEALKAKICTVNANVANAAARAAANAANSIIDKASANISAEKAVSALTININFREILISDARNDFELLKEASKRNDWKDDTPVPQNIFGERVKHNLSLPLLPQHNIISKNSYDILGEGNKHKYDVSLTSIEGMSIAEENVGHHHDLEKNLMLSLLKESIEGLRDLLQPTKQGIGMFVRGKGGQQIAKVKEILTNNVEKICNLENEIQKLNHAHSQAMYKLETERRKQRAENIKTYVDSYLQLRETKSDTETDKLKELILSNLKDESYL